MKIKWNLPMSIGVVIGLLFSIATWNVLTLQPQTHKTKPKPVPPAARSHQQTSVGDYPNASELTAISQKNHHCPSAADISAKMTEIANSGGSQLVLATNLMVPDGSSNFIHLPVKCQAYMEQQVYLLLEKGYKIKIDVNKSSGQAEQMTIRW